MFILTVGYKDQIRSRKEEPWFCYRNKKRRLYTAFEYIAPDKSLQNYTFLRQHLEAASSRYLQSYLLKQNFSSTSASILEPEPLLPTIHSRPHQKVQSLVDQNCASIK
jgi:hypothetical protein